jgi:hypothetical protein
MPAASIEAMNQHLVEISTQVSPGAHAVLVCDSAGWHQRGKRLHVLAPQPILQPRRLACDVCSPGCLSWVALRLGFEPGSDRHLARSSDRKAYAARRQPNLALMHYAEGLSLCPR